MTGIVSEAGLLAGGLNACVYSRPNCTGMSGGFNDAAGAGPVTLYDGEGWRDVVSWRVTRASC